EIAAQLALDLAVAEAERHFLVDDEQQHMQSQAMAWQRLGDGVLMIGAAFGTPAALDHKLGNQGWAHQDDILDHPLTGGAAATEAGAAVGTALRGGYHLGLINPGGTPPASAHVTRCATARFGHSGVVRERSSGERFAFEV